MNRQETTKLANELMAKHNLTDLGWTFKLDSTRRRLGVCKFRTKTIAVSGYLLPFTKDEEIKDTILHEIAHALVGRGHGHNHVWRAKAREVGCRAERCYNSQEAFVEGASEQLAKQSKYTLTCPSCGRTTPAHRRPKRSKSCGKCSGRTYKPEFKMQVTQNY